MGAGPFAGSSDALALAELARRASAQKRMLAVVSADPLAAQRLAEEVPWFAPELRVALLPDWETLPYDQFSPHQDLVSERLATLYHVSRGECDVLIVCRRRRRSTGWRRPRTSPAFTFFLKQGETLDVDALRAQLALAGYTHVTQVVSPGEFSVRGGLIDLFPMGSALPYRIDLFDDEIETHQAPSTSTRSARSTRCATCACCPRASFRSTRRAARASAAASAKCSRAIRRSRALYKDVSNGVVPGGIEYYLPLFFDATATLADYLPHDAVVVLHGDVRGAVERFWQDTRVALPAAARRQGAAAAAADRAVPPARRCSSARSSRSPASRCRAAATRRAAARAPTRRCRRCRSTGAPTIRCGAEALRRSDRPARVADRRRERRPARDDAALLRRVRLAVRARATTSPAFSRASDARACWSSAPLARRLRLAARRARVRHRRRAVRGAVVRRTAREAGEAQQRRRDAARPVRGAHRRSGRPRAARHRPLPRLPTLDLGDGADEFLQLVYANDDKLYVPVTQPASHRPLQRRLAGSRAAARARQRPVGEGQEARRRSRRTIRPPSC